MTKGFAKALKLAPLMLFLSLGALTACSGSSGSDAASETGVKGKAKGLTNGGGSTTSTGGSTSTPSPTPTPTPTPASTVYDTSVGLGVDAYGYANLPLRSGARRFFVNSSTGSDSNGCTAAQQPASALRSMAAAITCVQGGNGDQVLVAEGTRYSEGLPNLDSKAGNSAAYPTVLESYDPSDPANEGKYGRAANGRRPVINTGANAQAMTCCSTAPARYLAIRGFDINPGNVPDMTMSFVGSNGLSNSYILIENNIFRYTMLTVQQDDRSKGSNIVVRKNAIYGTWSSSAHAQGLYMAGVSSFTAEDNVFWHTGWKIGVSRDADPTVGGPTIFRHSIYQQDNADGVVRRNIFIDPSATGCSCRGNTTVSENVFIDNPISIIGGLGTNYNVAQPNGVDIQIAYNAILGDADINSANPRGAGIQTGNGKQGSSVHHNLLVRTRNPGAVNVFAFNTQAGANQPSYADIHDNLEYLWAATGKVKVLSGDYLAQDLPTYQFNAWSDPTSGTNVNSSSKSFPNPYTEAQLFAALGCTDKATCVSAMIETPEAGWAPKARALLFAGYGL